MKKEIVIKLLLLIKIINYINNLQQWLSQSSFCFNIYYFFLAAYVLMIGMEIQNFNDFNKK